MVGVVDAQIKKDLNVIFNYLWPTNRNR